MDSRAAYSRNPGFRDFVSIVLSDSSTIIKTVDRRCAKRFLGLRVVDALLTTAPGRQLPLGFGAFPLD